LQIYNNTARLASEVIDILKIFFVDNYFGILRSKLLIFARIYMAQDLLLKGSGPDILIRDGIIRRKGFGIEASPEVTVIDTTGYLVCGGFADLHVHFREPGYSYKETIRSGSMAAARGGYTTVCTMPNLDPVPDTQEHLRIEQDIIDRDAVIQVLPYASITIGRKGTELVDFKALKGRCVAFSDDGSGVQSREIMLRAMEKAAENDCIIAAHCEDNSLLHGGYIHDGAWCRTHSHKGICSESEWGQIKRDLELAELTGCHYHICHISTAESVELIARAKDRGVMVTCETAPHYLTLCEDDMREDGRFKMNPPLRSKADREALVRGLCDGTIDAIATDHAPHSEEEKSKGLEHSAMGITGLETAFPELYTRLCIGEKVPVAKIINALTTSPRSAFRLKNVFEEGCAADITVIDTRKEFTIDSRNFLSKGHSTPFDGDKVYGKVTMTFKDGKLVWKDNN